MAFKEVELSAEEQASSGQTFFKFSAIGDRMAGVFISSKVVAGKFGEKREYLFRTREGNVALTPPTDAARKLEKANLKPGWKVIVTYTGDRDVGKEQPMKQFKVLVDTEIGAPVAAPAPVVAAPAVDDLPF